MNSKNFLVLAILLCFSALAKAQVMKEDSTWWDNNLRFEVTYDAIATRGELDVCIFSTEKNNCIFNLMTSFEMRIYNRQGEEIWNAFWMGTKKELKLRKKLPDAYKIVFTAKHPFVINKSTGTKIYQDKPITTTYMVIQRNKP